MKERFKTILLAGLILLSLYLTYILWFGSPYLEEGVLPRYEFASFSAPPPHDALVMPAAVVLQRDGEEAETHLLRRGEAEHARVWQTAYELLRRRLPGIVGERPTEEDLMLLLDDVSFELLFRFNPPLPESFLWDNGSPAEVHGITLFGSGEDYYVLLDGNEKVLYRWINWGESELINLITTIETDSSTINDYLPPRFVLQASYPDDDTEAVTTIVPPLENIEVQPENDLTNTDIEDEALTGENEATSRDEPAQENGVHNREEDGEEDGEENREENREENGEEDGEGNEDNTPPDEMLPQNGEVDEEEILPPVDQVKNWEIAVRGHIYVPTAVTATELVLTKEILPEKELVSAFFLDPAMARRIEERDGAIYFTDGKKGLRLYAGGTVEYTAPGLEIFNNRISYSAALLEAAENQSLYGGWPSGVFLERREKTAGGYRFFWRSYAEGFPLVTDESSCEMLVNDKGMPYYRRSFYIVTDKTGDSQTYAHYKEVLYQALNLHEESFPFLQATLLALEPVYRVVTVEAGARAVPAWSVHFAETGRFYLHWQTLELL